MKVNGDAKPLYSRDFSGHPPARRAGRETGSSAEASGAHTRPVGSSADAAGECARPPGEVGSDPSITLSPRAQGIQEARRLLVDLSTYDEEKVFRVREEVGRGGYLSPEKLRAVARKLRDVVS